MGHNNAHVGAILPNKSLIMMFPAVKFVDTLSMRVPKYEYSKLIFWLCDDSCNRLKALNVTTTYKTMAFTGSTELIFSLFILY